VSTSAFRLLQSAPFISALFLSGLPMSHASMLDNILGKLERQSPIDIRSDNTYFSKLPDLKFTLSSDTSLDIINNGSPDHESTIRANINVGEGALKLSGHTWDLAQFHFHAPSEHLLNGQASPMEMHLVFSDSRDNLLVVGRWIKEGGYNSALDPIFSNLPQTTSDISHVDHFNLNTLVPDNLNSFRYSGSLTTPPFSEGVSWVDLAQPLYMSESQIDAFKSLFPEGNTREVQPLNGRLILTDVPGFAEPLHLTDALGSLIPGINIEGQLPLTADISNFATAVPEPEMYAMLLAGLGLIGFTARREKRQSRKLAQSV
jgi:carbonic anhydrase